MLAPQWINDHKVDWQRGEVTVATQVKSVEPKAMAVLQVLVEANGNVVTQQEILNRVWKDVVVAPNALQRCIAQLRKVFNDDAKVQSVIKTHPKLGYSLAAHVSQSSSERLVTSSSFKLYTLIAFAVIALVSGLLWPPQDKVATSIHKISMITSDDVAQFGGAIVADNIVFIEGTQPRQQRIVAKQLNGSKAQVLSDNLWINGGLAVNVEQNALYFSRLLFIGDTKCSEIAKLPLPQNINQTSTNDLNSPEAVIPCVKGFYHQPQSYGTNQLLTLHHNGNDVNRLQLHDLIDGGVQNISHQLGNLVALSVERETKQLAILSHQQENFQLSLAQLIKGRVEVVQQWAVDDVVAQSAIHWISAKEFAVVGSQSLEFFAQNGHRRSVSMPSRDELFAVLNYDDRLVVELGREDWDVHQASLGRDGSAIKPEVIARSIYADSSGRFRPKHASISVLSTRSGSSQLWLKSDRATHQLTDSQFDVSSYVWSADGQSVVYVSNDVLWTQVIGESAQQIATPFKVSSIYQWLSGDKNPHVLLNSIIDGHHWLVEFDLIQRVVTAKLDIDTQWAQRVEEGQYVISAQDGYLKKLQLSNNELEISDIDKTRPLKLQWRFFYRADYGLYFQDKHQNIWRWSNADLSLEKVGHYDEKTLLMTDIAPQQGRFLSDVFKRKVRDFAFID